MPIANAFANDYVKNIQSISQAFQPIDTNALQQAVSKGGSLTGSLGFGEGGIDVLGLTPEMVQNLVAQRGTIQQQNQNLLSGVTDLINNLTGSKETRQAMLTANRDIFGEQSQTQRDMTSQNLERELQENSQVFQSGLTDKKLSADWDQLRENHKFQKELADSNNVSEERRHRETLGLAQQKLDLEKRRQTAIEQSLVGDANEVAKYFPPSPEMFGKLESAKEHYYLNEDRKNYVTTHLQQRALGTPYGTYYSAGDFKDVLKGTVKGKSTSFDSLRLAPSGWYGVVKDKSGKVLGYSDTPLVPLNPNAVPKKGSAGKTMVNIYGEE